MSRYAPSRQLVVEACRRMADTDEVIDDALERFERVLSSVDGVRRAA